MLYNHNAMPAHVKTAGKITILTALLGVVIFSFVFLFNVGQKEYSEAIAQSTATTSVVVLNTPPQWLTGSATEAVASATSTPTNSGDVITWIATGTDSNSQPYQLLICSDVGAATPTAGNSNTDPVCPPGSVTWAVSATTTSGQQATAATTTVEAGPFAAGDAERFTWEAWICDSIDTDARCNLTPTFGTSSTVYTPNSSPFHVNNRPSFSAFTDDSPNVPGSVVTFTSTSDDPDDIGPNDTVFLTVCATSSYSNALDGCQGTTLATSTALVEQNATATYSIIIPTQDNTYGAFGYIRDNHGHEAIGGEQNQDTGLEVLNATPTVASTSIVINGGSDMIITNAAGTTTGFTLSFEVTDFNSCENSGGGDEVDDFLVSVYRSGVGLGASGCGGTTTALASSQYDPNNCYPSLIGTSTWNLSCTQDVATCGDAPADPTQDSTVEYNCTFPLWYVADPTGSSTASFYNLENWVAAVSAIDDNNATSTIHQETDPNNYVDVDPLLAFELNASEIVYGSVEPGSISGGTGNLHATSVIFATGNVGIDERLNGETMCDLTVFGVTIGNCPATQSTSSIDAQFQKFATDTVDYLTEGTALSSSTFTFLDLNVPKSTLTNTQASGTTYWGIQVPGTIELAGTYTGENTFIAVTSDPSQW